MGKSDREGGGRDEETEGRRTTLKGSSLLRESFQTFVGRKSN